MASEASETANVAASASSARLVPPATASSPTIAGPAIRESWLASSMAEFAVISPGPANRSFTTTVSADSKNTEQAPAARATARTSQIVSRPAADSAYSAANSAARTASIAISTRHGSSRSTSTPAGSPTSR
jgi:hypothetical protein